MIGQNRGTRYALDDRVFKRHRDRVRPDLYQRFGSKNPLSLSETSLPETTLA